MEELEGYNPPDMLMGSQDPNDILGYLLGAAGTLGAGKKAGMWNAQRYMKHGVMPRNKLEELIRQAIVTEHSTLTDLGLDKQIETLDETIDNLNRSKPASSEPKLLSRRTNRQTFRPSNVDIENAKKNQFGAIQATRDPLESLKTQAKQRGSIVDMLRRLAENFDAEEYGNIIAPEEKKVKYGRTILKDAGTNAGDIFGNLDTADEEEVIEAATKKGKKIPKYVTEGYGRPQGGGGISMEDLEKRKIALRESIAKGVYGTDTPHQQNLAKNFTPRVIQENTQNVAETFTPADDFVRMLSEKWGAGLRGHEGYELGEENVRKILQEIHDARATGASGLPVVHLMVYDPNKRKLYPYDAKSFTPKQIEGGQGRIVKVVDGKVEWMIPETDMSRFRKNLTGEEQVSRVIANNAVDERNKKMGDVFDKGQKKGTTVSLDALEDAMHMDYGTQTTRGSVSRAEERELAESIANQSRKEGIYIDREGKPTGLGKVVDEVADSSPQTKISYVSARSNEELFLQGKYGKALKIEDNGTLTYHGKPVPQKETEQLMAEAAEGVKRLNETGTTQPLPTAEEKKALQKAQNAEFRNARLGKAKELKTKMKAAETNIGDAAKLRTVIRPEIQQELSGLSKLLRKFGVSRETIQDAEKVVKPVGEVIKKIGKKGR